MNAERKTLTAVACHPTREEVATGDETGKIFVYTDIYAKSSTPKNVLYHWHHGPVQSITYTAGGTRLYSGGHERVLLGWTTDKHSNIKPSYLPRLSGGIVHIAVSCNNQKIAISTDDNGKSMNIFYCKVIVNRQLRATRL